MRPAVERALEVRASLGLTGVASRAHVAAAIAAAGLGYRDDRPYRGRIQGRLYRNTVCVRGDLWPDQKLVVSAHELGHALLGHADGAFYARGADDVGADEAAAQVFAWTLLVGEPADTLDGLTRQLHAGWDAGIPIDFLCAAATILARDLVRGPAAPSPRRSRPRARARAASGPEPPPVE